MQSTRGCLQGEAAATRESCNALPWKGLQRSRSSPISTFTEAAQSNPHPTQQWQRNKTHHELLNPTLEPKKTQRCGGTGFSELSSSSVRFHRPHSPQAMLLAVLTPKYLPWLAPSSRVVQSSSACTLRGGGTGHPRAAAPLGHAKGCWGCCPVTLSSQ